VGERGGGELRYFRGAKVTGIPVRGEFFAVEAKEISSRPLHLLVFGGSQGARVFNAVMPKITKELLERVPGLTILHQAGAKFGKTTEEAYKASGADASRWRVAEFLEDMPRRFADADLILCRSGASTVAELAAAGRASVLVPFPGAADNHQLKNAEVLQAAGAAELRVQEPDELMAASLLSDLSSLLQNSERREEMGNKVCALAHPNAVQEIGAMIVELARRG
jgi:UDP-N-acetylglucosamine--N-acetylmuramyl-(pentapeptide) pyrophosphoryl-undecaprenol N-acetylglucosamine transferase